MQEMPKMPELPNYDGLDSFLDKVDEIGQIVSGLSSTDKETVADSMLKSDKLISKLKVDEDVTENIKTKTGFSKSFINKSSSEQPVNGPSPMPTGPSDQDGFMKIMEQDAQERFRNKQKARKKADEIKLKGNEQFGLKNYEKALGFYTEAINVLRDNTVIYTNRAQCYIMLKRYEEAIEDCEWALRVNEKFIKAFIHKGRAFTYLKRFDEALVEFENAKKADATVANFKIIDDYIKEMERCRQTDKQEKSVEHFLNADSTQKPENNLISIIENLNKRLAENILYYSGGLRAVTSTCTNLDQKTLFRIQGGFKLFYEHPVISKCLSNASQIEKLEAEELDLIMSCFELFASLCTQCDENIKFLFDMNVNMADRILSLVSFDESELNTKEMKTTMQILKLTVLDLLKVVSNHEFGIRQICLKLNLNKLTNSLTNINLNQTAKTEAHALKIKSLEIVQNLILDTNIQSKLQDDDVTNFITNILAILKCNDDEYIQSLIYTIIYALTNKTTFRAILISTQQIWIQSLITLTKLSTRMTKSSDELLSVTLCLLVNMCSIKSENLNTYCKKIIEMTMKFTDIKTDAALKLIGNIIQTDAKRSDIYTNLNENFVSKLIDNVKANKSLDQSLKVLALCTTYSESYCNQLLAADPSCSFLYNLFMDISETKNGVGKSQAKNVNLKKFNETQINNAALTMSNCVNNSSQGALNLSKKLADGNIMMDLLYLTRDGQSKDMQKNCGILIAKLCKSDQTHLIRLRELHGVEILHTALKDCNI